MAFSTKQNLINAKFYQQDGGILTLSGDTSVADVGRLAYLTDQTSVFNANPRAIPDTSWVTGKTSGVVTCIANNYYNKTQINSYTGQTDTRIDVIEAKYLTGATNGVGYTGKNVCLGGALVANTIIGTGSNLFGVNAANINLTGATVSTSGVIKLISTPAAGLTSDSILVWNSTDKTVKVVSGGAVLTSAITGATNGLTKSGQQVKLGGTLTEATTITAVDTTSLLFTDSRTTPIGIQYGGDYGVNFTARSLPDAGYVTGKTSAILTCLNNDFYNKTCINSYTGQTLNNINSRLLTSTFATYTGTTVPNTYYNKTQINSYTAATDTRIDALEVVSNVALTGATNGLTKTGRNVKLGGTLSEVTVISGSSQLCLKAPFNAVCVQDFVFDETPTPDAYVEGRLYYKNNNLNFDREISGTTLQIGEENVVKVHNSSGGVISNGNAVYISGAAGTIPLVTKSIASVEAQAINTIGLSTNNINNGDDGYITTFGLVHDLNTNAWTAGTPIYLSATVAGGLTSTKPSYPNEVVLLGYVTYQDSVAGTIMVDVREQTEYINYGQFTGYTAQTQSQINSKLSIATFNSYSAATDTRIDNIEVITAVAVTGATNGLTCVSPRRIKLGGALTENTTVCSLSNTLTLGKLNCAVIDVAGASSAICLLAEDSGSIYLQSVTGGTFSNTFTGAVGMFIDYNAASESGFMAYDNRPTKRGIQYAADYSSTYCARSLVDKAYVDSVATGLNVHASVQVASTAPLTLSGSQSVDGYSTQNGWRVLVKDQVNQALNGIYISTGVTWYRADDYNFSPLGEISNGDLIPVVSGNTNNNTQWILTTPNPIVSGNSLVYSQFSKTITISQGNGIDITPVSGSQQISVELAPNNAGLCFLGSGLRIDNAMFDYGLCYYTTGGNARACVNGVKCNPVGTVIPVSIYTGSTCQLYVDSSCIVSAAGAITSANNGLTKQGVNVKLGGSLTGDTTITGGGTLDLGLNMLDAFALSFNSSTITDNSGGEGLVYAANYAPTFIDNSLVSKYFVNNAITGSTLTYNNGLTKAGSVISWGGTLTGNTQVARGGAILCFTCNAGVSCVDLYTTCSRFHTEDTFAQLQSCTNGSCLGTICLNNTGEIKLSTSNATLPILITAPQAMKYAANYSSTFTARSIPDAAWVTGLTTTAGLQTANNGLTKVGTNVVLGGALLNNTILSGNFTLNISGGSKLSTTCGYQINSKTVIKTTDSNTSFYAGDCAGNVSTGADNTGVGRGTLTGNTTGLGNSAFGAYALICNKIGCYNNSFGYGTLAGGCCGNGNVAVGYYALYYNNGGNCNIAIGAQTLQNNTTGSNNIGMGDNAMICKTTGSDNISLGRQSSFFNTTGSYNVAIGCAAGYNNVTGNTNVFIGYNAGLNELTSNKLYIANTSACNLIYGDFANNFVTLPTVKICNTPATGINTDGFLVWNSVDKCVKQVNVGSIVSASITGATNGLTKTGQNVKLGGALTETTTINGAQTIRFNVTNFNVTGATNLTGALNVSSNIDGNGTLDILGATALRSTLNVTGATTLGSTLNVTGNIDGNGTLDILGATSLRSTLNVTGATTFNTVATYNTSKAPFTALQIPEAQWVTGLTSQAILTATNGLTKVGKEVKLGGALTGNTSITGAYTLGVNVTTVNLTGTSVNVGGTVKLTTAPASGAITDTVLVRASDGTVKTVPGNSLGDRNNIYSRTTITSSSVLNTGSSYVILVDHAGISVTVTLPSTPLNGQAFKIKDVTGNALTFPITIAGNGNNIDGAASGMINTDYGALEIVYDQTLDQWYTLAFIN
jgi:hypothetical protein